jgi:endonuclease/exonuclease/phosphatase family metal-dependent hydrolase
MLQSPFIVMAAFLSVFRLAGYFTEPRLDSREIHQIWGEPTRTASPLGLRRPLRVVSWNIERGVRFDSILATLRALEPDIILLQEVDRFCRRTANRDIARDLGDQLDMNWVAAGEFQEIGEGRPGQAALTGQALLSKYPIRDATVLVFDAQARVRWRFNPIQPRRGGRIALKAHTAGLLLYNAHIESGGNDALRRWQLDEVIADQDREARPAVPTIIGGDFNNVPRDRSTMFRRLTAASFVDVLGSADGRRTSIRHRHPIDWIFGKNVVAAGGSVPDVARASDHFPLVANLSHLGHDDSLDRPAAAAAGRTPGDQPDSNRRP